MLDPVSFGVVSLVCAGGAIAARLRANGIEVVGLRGPLDTALQEAFPVCEDTSPEFAHLMSKLDEIE